MNEQPPAEEEPLTANPHAVILLVRVPPQARVWIDNTPMKQAGPIRLFESPPLEPNSDYQYYIQATWVENGREVSRTRKVTIRAGDRLMVNFASPNRPEEPPPPAP
jgi:uncharacterized protein (TIGR03000 family)